MFLSRLSYKQRKIFLGLAKEILVVDDGEIDKFEEEYLRGLCAEMSLSFSDETVIKKEELKEYFFKEQDKRILLLELIALGYSNENYHDLQNKYTDDICTLLELSTEELDSVEELLKDYHQIQNKFIEYIKE